MRKITSIRYSLSKLQNIFRKQRIVILLFFDVIIIFLSYFLSILLKLDNIYVDKKDIIFLVIFIFSSIFFYTLSGQYHNISRYTGSNTVYKIAIRNLIFFFVIFFINNIFFNSRLGLNFTILFLVNYDIHYGIFQIFISRYSYKDE